MNQTAPIQDDEEDAKPEPVGNRDAFDALLRRAVCVEPEQPAEETSPED